jgi:replication-associated recombination protein RarA
MKFLDNLFHKSQQNRFENIEGYQDIKNIIIRVLDSEDSYNLLFCGPPASSKTLFLLEIMKYYKDAQYFDGSNTTSRILDVLEEEGPMIITIDELDKMPRQFQNQLLNFMESGRVKVDMQKKQYDFEIKGAKVFATCNEIKRLSKPLQSRFRKIYLPRYTEEQFVSVSIKVLKNLNLNQDLARYIGTTVFKMEGDIRDVLSIGKLLRREDGPVEADRLIRTLMKYGGSSS